jgi:hypothetical protein
MPLPNGEPEDILFAGFWRASGYESTVGLSTVYDVGRTEIKSGESARRQNCLKTWDVAPHRRWNA